MSIDPKKFGLSDSLVNAVNEALKGGQKNLDKAPPFGKLTGDDFKKLRGEQTPGGKEDTNYNHGMMKPHAKNEEVENVDEVSSAMLYRAKKAAEKKASWLMPGDKGKGDKAWNRVKKFRDAGVAKEKQERSIKKEEVENVDEATKYFSPKDRESAARSARTSRAAAANPAQPKDKAAQHSKEAEWLEKLSKKRTISTNNEEVEGLDELKGNKSGLTKLGYVGKAGKFIRKTDPKDIANDPDTERKFKNRMTGLKNLLKKTQKEEVVDEAQTKQQRAARAALATQGGAYDGGKKGGAINRMALMKPKDLKKLAIAKEEVEQIDEVGDTPQGRNKLRDYLVKAKKSGDNEHMMYKMGKAIGNAPDSDNVRALRNRGSGIRSAKARINRGMYREEVVDEAAVAGTNVAADMDARKTEIQRRIAAKQASFQQAKANKRISSSTIREAKCSCGEAKGSKMTCEMHGDKKSLKGGKEPILMNPPLKETYSKTKY